MTHCWTNVRRHPEGYNSQQGNICYSYQVWFLWSSWYLVVMVSQGCTEMASVSRVTEQELQMLLLCHLHLTVMSLLCRRSPAAARPDRCGGLCALGLAQSAAKAPPRLFALASFSVCPLGLTRGRVPVLIQENPFMVLKSILLYFSNSFKYSFMVNRWAWPRHPVFCSKTPFTLVVLSVSLLDKIQMSFNKLLFTLSCIYLFARSQIWLH